MTPRKAALEVRRRGHSRSTALVYFVMQPLVWYAFAFWFFLTGITAMASEPFLHMQHAGGIFVTAVCAAGCAEVLRRWPLPLPVSLVPQIEIPAWQRAQVGWTARIIDGIDIVNVTVLETDDVSAYLELPDGQHTTVVKAELLDATPPPGPKRAPNGRWWNDEPAPVLVPAGTKMVTAQPTSAVDIDQRIDALTVDLIQGNGPNLIIQAEKADEIKQLISLRKSFDAHRKTLAGSQRVHQHHVDVDTETCTFCGEIIPDIQVRAFEPPRLAVEVIHNNVAVRIPLTSNADHLTTALIYARPLPKHPGTYDYGPVYSRYGVPPAPAGAVAIAAINVPATSAAIQQNMIYRVHD